MVKPSLPPGFRFHPTDVELVKYYLKRKISGKKLHFEGITEIDIHKYPPWDLPAKSSLHGGDLKWYFFSPVERKYASGGRMNRATEFGYWKTTGKDRPVHYNNEVVGMIKTLIFHIGRAPRGERTNWVIHEYRLVEKIWADNGIVQDSYVLCMVYQKDGPGPRNNAQYGAPFNEEDWTDDEEENRNGQSVNASIVEVLPSSQTGTESVPITAHYTGCPSVLNIPYARPLAGECSSAANISYIGSLAGECSSAANISYVGSLAVGCSSASKSSYVGSLPLGCSSVSNNPYAGPLAVGYSSVSKNPYAGPLAGYDATTEKQVSEVDDIEAMLALFVEEECNDPQGQKDIGIPCTHGADIYKDLGDLGNLAALHEDNIGTSAGHEACNTWGQMLPLNDVAFLEMIDLETPLSCPNELFKDGYNYF